MPSQDNTPTEDDGPDETFVVAGQRPMGFSILYHDTARRLIWEHSAVLKTYILIATFTDSKRDAHPSIQRIADMTDQNRRTVQRAISRLEELGLIHIARHQNLPSIYHLLSPHDEGYAKGKVGSDEGGRSGDRSGMDATGGAVSMSQGGRSPDRPNNNHEQKPINKTTTPPTPSSRVHDPHADSRTEEEEEAVDRIRQEYDAPTPDQSREVAQENERQSSQSVQSNRQSQTPLDQERALPYWHENDGERAKSFKAIMDLYPKPGDKLKAAQAYRTVIGTRADSPDGVAFFKHVWERMQDWMEHWQREGTEDRYINFLASWIEKEKWNEVPGVRRR